MKITIFAFTAQGKRTGLRIRWALSGDEVSLRAPEKLSDEGYIAYEGGLSSAVGACFDQDALIFVGAAGIAVRGIAPHVASKRSDPAVICIDERGRFVIPILSGHIGGANRLARQLSEALMATQVITTATDVNGRFSVDTWATEHHMAIGSMALAKRVSAEILTRDIPIASDHALPDALPSGLMKADHGPLGLWVSIRDRHPFDQTLQLIPRVLRLGLGCRRGTAAEAIDQAVGEVFRREKLRFEGVVDASSIDVKSDEAGLIEYCRERDLPIAFYTAEALNRVPGEYTSSNFVKNTVGVDNVCERAAAAGGGQIIVKKTAINGVTVAVSEMKWGIDFG